MSKYTTTTAALKATAVDTRLLDAKIIKLNGQDINDLIGKEPQLEDKVTRVDLRKLKEEGYCYLVVDDMGKLVGGDFDNLEEVGVTSLFNNYSWPDFSIDMPKLVDGSSMFSNSDIFSFSANIDSLENGRSMFCYSAFLEDFKSELPNLKDGENMFSLCDSLSGESVLHILRCLKYNNSMNTTATIDFNKYSFDSIQEWFGEDCYNEIVGLLDNVQTNTYDMLKGTFTNNSGGVWTVLIYTDSD